MAISRIDIKLLYHSYAIKAGNMEFAVMAGDGINFSYVHAWHAVPAKRATFGCRIYINYNNCNERQFGAGRSMNAA